MDTSQEAYEAAAERFVQIASAITRRKAELEAAIDALDDEWDAAQDALREHEAAPGIPAWDHTTDPAECRVRRCKIHSQARPVPIRLDGCTCGGIGDTGSHRAGCQWAASA